MGSFSFVVFPEGIQQGSFSICPNGFVSVQPGGIQSLSYVPFDPIMDEISLLSCPFIDGSSFTEGQHKIGSLKGVGHSVVQSVGISVKFKVLEEGFSFSSLSLIGSWWNAFQCSVLTSRGLLCSWGSSC
jgi:hypothetical protein